MSAAIWAGLQAGICTALPRHGPGRVLHSSGRAVYPRQMRAAVIGTGWGGVHVAALREAGVEVVALVGRDPRRTGEAARRMGVGQALVDVAPLDDLDLDLITVATPADTHAAVIRQLPDVAVLCEKPAVGLAALTGQPADRSAPVWVNYAFAFLEVAMQAATHMAEIGAITSVDIVSGHDLPDAGFREEQMFLEVAAHPWSWVVALLGAPDPQARRLHAPEGDVVLRTVCATVPVTVASVHRPGLTGLSHSVEILGDQGMISVAGRYRVGHDWHFDAPRIHRPDGSHVHVGGSEAGPGDPWYRANARGIRAVVAAVGGQPAAPMLFGWDAALAMDGAAQAGLVPPGG
jgi:dTDP-4-dehydrorhamnose reductase